MTKHRLKQHLGSTCVRRRNHRLYLDRSSNTRKRRAVRWSGFWRWTRPWWRSRYGSEDDEPREPSSLPRPKVDFKINLFQTRFYNPPTITITRQRFRALQFSKYVYSLDKFQVTLSGNTDWQAGVNGYLVSNSTHWLVVIEDGKSG